jgi:hypothetical protein
VSASCNKALRQEADVLGAVSQRRYYYGKNTKPVVQILPKSSRFDLFVELTVGRGENTHIYAAHMIDSNTFKGAFLQNS